MEYSRRKGVNPFAKRREVIKEARRKKGGDRAIPTQIMTVQHGEDRMVLEISWKELAMIDL